MDAQILDPTKDISLELSPYETFDEKSKKAFEFFAGHKLCEKFLAPYCKVLNLLQRNNVSTLVTIKQIAG